MEDITIYRKISIIDKLKKLFTDNSDYNVAQLLHTAMRSKNIRGNIKDSYFMSDEDFLISLENTIKEFKQKVDE